MFGDGDSSFSISPKHVYDTGAVYTVTLYTYSNNGCVSTKTKEITIYPTPDISISGAPVCLGDTSSFSSIINIQGGGNIVEFYGTLEMVTDPFPKTPAICINMIAHSL